MLDAVTFDLGCALRPTFALPDASGLAPLALPTAFASRSSLSDDAPILPQQPSSDAIRRFDAAMNSESVVVPLRVIASSHVATEDSVTSTPRPIIGCTEQLVEQAVVSPDKPADAIEKIPVPSAEKAEVVVAVRKQTVETVERPVGASAVNVVVEKPVVATVERSVATSAGTFVVEKSVVAPTEKPTPVAQTVAQTIVTPVAKRPIGPVESEMQQPAVATAERPKAPAIVVAPDRPAVVVVKNVQTLSVGTPGVAIAEPPIVAAVEKPTLSAVEKPVIATVEKPTPIAQTVTQTVVMPVAERPVGSVKSELQQSAVATIELPKAPTVVAPDAPAAVVVKNAQTLSVGTPVVVAAEPPAVAAVEKPTLSAVEKPAVATVEKSTPVAQTVTQTVVTPVAEKPVGPVKSEIQQPAVAMADLPKIPAVVPLGETAGVIEKAPAMSVEAPPVIVAAEKPMVEKPVDFSIEEPEEKSVAASAHVVVAPTTVETSVPQAVQPELAVAAATARTEAIVETVNQIVEAVVGQILVTPGIVRGECEIKIALKPNVLDGSEITMSSKDGTLAVYIAPATQEASAVAAAALPRLETALAEHAPAFHHVSVALASKKGKDNEAV